MSSKYEDLPPCDICGTPFDNVFEAIDHTLDDEYLEVFDPKLILPGGYSLMVGSLLRCIYGAADEPSRVKHIVQDVYATLFAAEHHGENEMRQYIEDTIVDNQMEKFDEQLEELLNGSND